MAEILSPRAVVFTGKELRTLSKDKTTEQIISTVITDSQRQSRVPKKQKKR